jgi:6-pyruvoyltetrahydropterin/6-carboxytetrahydropterin synthase
MHILARRIRFSVNPFLPVDTEGFNSFACKPTGEGFSIFLELTVELTGKIDQTTGFLINVSDIDMNVRKFVVPVFAGHIRENFNNGKHINFIKIVELLRLAWSQLADKFGSVRIKKLGLKLNPFRTVTVDSQDANMVYFSEKFEFAAMHKLWNDDFSEERNFEVFGKCANPTGHGHNYIVEVTVKKPPAADTFSIAMFERIVDEELVKLLDHKNLNADIGEFSKVNPTVENIAAFAWEKLVAKFGQAMLHCVTVWETDRTYCSYYG